MRAVDRHRAESFLYQLCCWLVDLDDWQQLIDAEDNRALFVQFDHDWHAPAPGRHRLGGAAGYSVRVVGHLDADEKRKSVFSRIELWQDSQIEPQLICPADRRDVAQHWVQTWTLDDANLQHLLGLVDWAYQQRVMR